MWPSSSSGRSLVTTGTSSIKVYNLFHEAICIALHHDVFHHILHNHVILFYITCTCFLSICFPIHFFFFKFLSLCLRGGDRKFTEIVVVNFSFGFQVHLFGPLQNVDYRPCAVASFHFGMFETRALLYYYYIFFYVVAQDAILLKMNSKPSTLSSASIWFL